MTTAHHARNPAPIGFYALALKNDLVEKLGHGQSYGFDNSQFPAIHLLYIAVHQAMQRRSLGTFMLGQVIETVYDISRRVGVYALTLNAIDNKTAAFYAKQGFQEYGDPTSTPSMLLPIQTIVEVVEKNRAPRASV